MKNFVFIFLFFCLSLYSQTNTAITTLRIDTNFFMSSFDGKLQPAWVYIGEAKRAINDGNSSYALFIMNKTLLYYPENADAHYLLGMIYESEAGKPSEQGGIATYRLAVEEYKKSIQYANNLTIPSYKYDAYFNLLDIYEKLIDQTNYSQTEQEIINMAERSYNKMEKGRIYFKLAEHYDARNRRTSAIDYYRQSYLNGYRQKLSLFRISIIYRKMRNYVQEKETLMLASGYSFENEEPSNFEVDKIIINRLEQLKNVKIPRKIY